VDQAELVQLSHIRRTRQHLVRHPEVFEAATAGWNAASAPATGSAWPPGGDALSRRASVAESH
jgi:hypothetical protein